jgi:tetratricopeptide (TPR) repeat protein
MIGRRAADAGLLATTTCFLGGSSAELPQCGSCEVSLSVTGTNFFGSISNKANDQLSPNVARVASNLSDHVDTAPGGAATRTFAILVRGDVSRALLLAAAQADPGALADTAKNLALEKRYDEAAALWQQALKTAPDHWPSLFNLAYMYFSLSDFARAEPLLARAANVRPADFNTHYLLGSTLVRLGKREQGLREWRTALELQPGNVRLMQIMAVEYGNGAYFKEACDIARRALGDLNAYLVAIKACEDARDPAALELARDAATKFPDSARANFEYGFQLQRHGRTEDSLPYLRKAMAADPAYEEPFFFYGDLLLKEGKYADAIGYLQAALKNRPDYVAACVSLGKALLGLEKLADAASQLERCDPKHPQPHLLLSQVYFRLGDEARARREKEISLRLRRENPTAMEATQIRPFPTR